MVHVLEHIPNPVQDLKFAYQLLKPGGYVVGETENIFSWDFNILKRFWGLLSLPRHLFFFTPDSLKFIAGITGFKLFKINFQLNTEGWALGTQFFYRNRLKSNTFKIRGRFYPLLLIFFIPISLVQKLFKKSGVVEFVFRKPL